MKVDVTIPEFSESISEGTIGDWLKKVGDPVEAGETLVEIETDKVVLEIPSPATGVLQEIAKQVNETVVSQDIVGVIDSSEAAATASTSTEPKPVEEAPNNPPTESNTTSATDESTIKTSPAVRKLLHEHELDKNELTPTGKSNRLTKSDVLNAVTSDKPEQVPQEISVAANSSNDIERVPMSSLRKRIAQRLVGAQNDYAMLTTFNEVDMHEILAIREKYKEKFLDHHGVKLGFMSFFVLAAVEALREFPIINASVEKDDIVYHNYMDIGIAVSAKQGLVVPVVRDAENKSLPQIELEINELASKARDNKLSIDDLVGGTFTITNGGVFGSMMSTPIINPPQSAILGMHSIEKRPVVENDEIVIRPMMYLALSYDHRIIDGRDAVLFLSRIKTIIQDPVQLLMHL